MADSLAMLGLSTGFLGLFAAFAVFFILLAIIMYLFVAFALMAIAKKTKTENGWLAFIPFGNLYLMTQIAKLPWWWMLAIFLVFIPFIGSLAATAAMVYIWWKIAEVRNRPGWWGVLMILPVVNFVLMGLLAWTD